MRSRRRFQTAASILSFAVLFSGQVAGAQTKVKPGVNFYSIKQDIEIGRRASADLDRRLAIVKDPQVQDWIDQLGHRLAAVTTRPDLPWQFRVVNSNELNAFSLPGGYVYINKGLILLSDSEGEVAAALAHEMAHVTLRHATNQLSKGAFWGGPFYGPYYGPPPGPGGYNLAFMRFGRTDETQADIVGTQTLAQAGYDPQAMVRLLEKLEKGQTNWGGPEFASERSDFGDRIKRVQKEIGYLKVGPNPLETSQQYVDVKAKLQAMPAPRVAPTPPPVARNYPDQPPQPNYPANPPSPYPNPRPNYPQPAPRPGEPQSMGSEIFQSPDGFYELEYPSNWRPWPPRGRNVIIAARNGFNTGGGDRQVNLGVVINYFEMAPPADQPGQAQPGQGMLDQAVTEAIKRVTADKNSYLSEEPNARNQGTLADRDAVGTYLVGRSASGENERDWLIVGPAGRGFVYLLFVSSDQDFARNQATFESIIESFRLNDGHFGAPRPRPDDRPEPPNPADR